MKQIIILAALVAVVVALPPPVLSDATQVAEILESEFKKEPDNSYVDKFKTSNGIEVEEVGTLKEVVGEDNKPVTVLVVKGSYAYKDNEGKQVSVTYTADENGFHPEGDSIPKAASK